MTYDATIIGAGPAGYVCAIRCAQLGQKTAIIERGELGGVCLNVGCIPSKAMIAAAHLLHKIRKAEAMGITVKGVELDLKKLVAWKDGIVGKLTGGVGGLLKAHKVDVIRGDAQVVSRTKTKTKTKAKTKTKIEVTDKSGKRLPVETRNLVIATGSRPIEIPGFAFDGVQVWSSTEALAPAEIPARLVVIGGGVIGLELGLVYHQLGSAVTVVEFMDRVLPGMDAELSKEMGRSLKKKKIKTHLSATAKSYEKTKGGLAVTVEIKGKDQIIECDAILSSVGRAPNGKGLGLEAIGVNVDDRGFIAVDPQRMTNVPGIYAIGDVAGQPMLAHKGSHEGLAAAAAIAGDRGAAYDPACVPSVVFTDPAVASVGLTAEEAKAAGFDPIEGKFPFAASGRAMALMETEGWVKVVGDKKTDKLLGMHMIGPEVTELIAEGGLAIELGATIEDIASTIHGHPTLTEAVMEASESVHDMAVHIFQAPKKSQAKTTAAR